MNFFQRYEKLAKSIGSSPNAVAKELGLSSGSLTAWKNGTDPSVKAVAKIADYFDVSMDYLLGIEKPTTPKKAQPITRREELMSELRYVLEDRSIEELERDLDVLRALKKK